MPNDSKRRRLLIVRGVLVFGLVIAMLLYWWFASRITHDLPVGRVSQPSEKDRQLACIDELPLSIKIGQKIMVAGYADTLASDAKIFAENNLVGVIVMDEIPKNEVASFKEIQSIPPFVAVDQEGGTVQRYTSEGLLPGASDIVSLSSSDVFARYLSDDKYLASVGITTNFAPVVDLKYPGRDPLPGRMYSGDPAVVTKYAGVVIDAAREAGIKPVIKHFPGIGSVDQSTDFASVKTVPFADLQAKDLILYRDLRDRNPDVMVSNAIIPGLSGGQPASLSRAVINDTLRKQYGYSDAVVYTDSLTAAALQGHSLAENSVMAWRAGADIALMVQTHENDGSLENIIARVVSGAEKAVSAGSLDGQEINQSVYRILSEKHVDPCSL